LPAHARFQVTVFPVIVQVAAGFELSEAVLAVESLDARLVVGEALVAANQNCKEAE